MTTKRTRTKDFSLSPSERATYGATVTARSLDTGGTRTWARTDVTAVEAVAEIAKTIDVTPGDYRIICISTPVTIRRDIFASRIGLIGDSAGVMGSGLPEVVYLGMIHRLDLLHPSITRPRSRNSTAA